MSLKSRNLNTSLWANLNLRSIFRFARSLEHIVKWKSHLDKELRAKDLKTQALLDDLLAVLHLWKRFCHEDSRYIHYIIYVKNINIWYICNEGNMFEEEDAWEYESFNWVGKVDSDDIRGSKRKKKKTANWFQIPGHGLHWFFLAINNYVKLSHGLRRMFHTGLHKTSSKSAIFHLEQGSLATTLLNEKVRI